MEAKFSKELVTRRTKYFAEQLNKGKPVLASRLGKLSEDNFHSLYVANKTITEEQAQEYLDSFADFFAIVVSKAGEVGY